MERNLDYLFDRTILLTCNVEEQLKRLKSRTNIDEKQAKKMISMQISHKNNLKIPEELRCNIVENNGTLSDLKNKTKQLYRDLYTNKK